MLEKLRLLARIVYSYGDVDFIQVVFFAQVGNSDFPVNFRLRIGVADQLTLPLEDEIPFVEEYKFAFPIVGSGFALQLIELNDRARRVTVGDFKVQQKLVELVLRPPSRIAFLPVPVIDVGCVWAFC